MGVIEAALICSVCIFIRQLQRAGGVPQSVQPVHYPVHKKMLNRLVKLIHGLQSVCTHPATDNYQ